MTLKILVRYGGLAALLSGLSYVVSLALIMGGGGAMTPLATALYVTSALFFLVTVAALYVVHRPQAPGLSLAASLAAGLSTVTGLFLDPTQVSPLWHVTALLWAGGLLGLGWLAYRSPALPKGLGATALLAGGLGVVMFLAGILSPGAELLGVLNLVLSVPYLIWLLWLAAIWRRPRSIVALS